MTHSHKSHEEIRKCALSFGPCWQNAGSVKNGKSKHNKPNGRHPDDKRTNY